MAKYAVWIMGREDETKEYFYAKTHRAAKATFVERNRTTSEITAIDLESQKV